MRLHRKQGGGFMTALEQTRPDLYKTISNYRSRLDEDKKEIFDKRGEIQYAASLNMPEQMRKDYYAGIEKEYAKPTEDQFKALDESLERKTFVPTYRYYKPQSTTSTKSSEEPFGPTTGYYRNLQTEIDEKQKFLDDLKFTETRRKTVPVYNYMEGQSGAPGIAGFNPGVARTTTNLPKGATYVPASGGGVSTTMEGYRAPDGTFYRKQGTKQITEKFERQAKAGDPEYDKAFGELGRLQTRHKYRNLYSTPSNSQTTGSNIYQKLGMTGTPTPTTPFARSIPSTTPFAKPIPSTNTSSPTMQMNKGGEIKGKGKAVRGFKFGGVR